jgi:hypothetical protein
MLGAVVRLQLVIQLALLLLQRGQLALPRLVLLAQQIRLCSVWGGGARVASVPSVLRPMDSAQLTIMVSNSSRKRRGVCQVRSLPVTSILKPVCCICQRLSS